MCVSLCVCQYICLSVCQSVGVYLYRCVSIYIYMSVHISVHLYVCVFVCDCHCLKRDTTYDSPAVGLICVSHSTNALQLVQ